MQPADESAARVELRGSAPVADEPGGRIHVVKRLTLIAPATLPSIKVKSNQIETRWAVDGKRQVNLDPGYVSLAKLVYHGFGADPQGDF